MKKKFTNQFCDLALQTEWQTNKLNEPDKQTDERQEPKSKGTSATSCTKILLKIF